MRIERCVNPACARPFQVNQFAGIPVNRGQKTLCPHCAQPLPYPENFTYLVHALSAEEEAAFNLTAASPQH